MRGSRSSRPSTRRWSRVCAPLGSSRQRSETTPEAAGRHRRAANVQNPVMRIVSLVPSATEMLFALGLGGDLVGVTHERDYPPAATELPRGTRNVLPTGLSA